MEQEYLERTKKVTSTTPPHWLSHAAQSYQNQSTELRERYTLHHCSLFKALPALPSLYIYFNPTPLNENKKNAL